MLQFSDIIGQDTLIDHLQDTLRTGAVSHASILVGPPGSGKKMLARTFAAALQCTDPQEVNGRIEPCGRCLSCIQAMSGSQPDIITVEREKSKVLGVGEIRRLRAGVDILPYASARKIYIIPDAQLMSVQAQNALLKTIEEPPSYVVVLLLADSTVNFLPTVLSRCITLQLRPVEERCIAQYLQQKKDLPPQQAGIYARFCGGSIGRAVLLSESEEFAALWRETTDLLGHLPQRSAPQIADFASRVHAAGQDEELLDLIRIWIRDLLVYRGCGQADRLIFAGEVQYIRETALAAGWSALWQCMEEVTAAAKKRKANVSAELTTELLLLQLRRLLTAQAEGREG